MALARGARGRVVERIRAQPAEREHVRQPNGLGRQVEQRTARYSATLLSSAC
jgi:hypothetical protein